MLYRLFVAHAATAAAAPERTQRAQQAAPLRGGNGTAGLGGEGWVCQGPTEDRQKCLSYLRRKEGAASPPGRAPTRQEQIGGYEICAGQS